MKKSISLIISAFVMIIISALSFYALADDTPLIELDSKNTSVELSYTSHTYNAKELKPKVTVTYTNPETNEQILLVQNKDYTVSYKNNVNVGSNATATITGIGGYTGTVSSKFKITAVKIKNSSSFDITTSYTTATYSGNAKTPKVKIYWIHNDTKTLLKQGSDYKVSYKHNTNVGKASITITGINNFANSVNKTFKIKPKKVTGLKATSTARTKINLKWTKQSSISGYELYQYNSSKKKYVRIARISSNQNTYTVTNLKPGYAQKFKIRSYKNIDDKTVYRGGYSSILKTATKPEKVVLKSVGKSGSSKIKLSWNKVKCTGYQITYSTDKNFKKNVKTVDIKKSGTTSYTIKNVNNNKTYYVKVRAYYSYNNKKYIGAYSQYLSTNYSNLYASYYSYYENNPNRTTNLRLASKAISGTIVQPGQTFSFNEVVGPRTAQKGYKSAHVFSDGGVVDGIGGGICQVASTMFNCALLSNVQIVERHQHSQRVAYVPLGRDAAIYGTVEDFKWKNNTKYAIKIVMTVKDGKISCSFYTCEDVKPKKVSLSVSQSGNYFKLTRKVDGKVNYSCSSNY